MAYTSKYTGEQIESRLDSLDTVQSNIDAVNNKIGVENLAYNTDFSNPVNTKGQTEYKGVQEGLDKWEISSVAWMVSLGDGFITISDNPDSTSTATGMFRQTIPITNKIRGKKVTFAAKVQGSDVRMNINNTDIGLYGNGDQWRIQLVTGTVPTEGDSFFIALQSRNATTYNVAWVMLCEGEYTEANLPPHINRGYEVENLRCNGALMAYPVNSVYISYSHTSPASLFGGTWERISNKFLWGGSNSATIGGTGGEQLTTLTIDQLPSHTHTFNGASSTTSSAGAHTHTRGSMNITGTFRLIGDGGNAGIDAPATGSGCITPINGTSSGSNVAASNWGCGQGFDFNAANNWSGETSSNGAHTHTVIPSGSNSNTGGGQTHNNMPPYIVVSMWRRVS